MGFNYSQATGKNLLVSHSAITHYLVTLWKCWNCPSVVLLARYAVCIAAPAAACQAAENVKNQILLHSLCSRQGMLTAALCCHLVLRQALHVAACHVAASAWTAMMAVPSWCACTCCTCEFCQPILSSPSVHVHSSAKLSQVTCLESI